MWNGIISLLAGLMVTVPVYADTKSIFLGASYLNSDSEFRGYSDDDDGYEIYFGYSLSKHLATEVSYFDFGTLHLPNIPDSGGRIDSDGISIQMVAMYPVDKFTLYGKLGNLWWDRKGVLGTIAGPAKFDSDGSDLMYGIGCSYDITAHLDVTAEYKIAKIGDDSKLSSVGISYHF
jgi:hypothetical protein